MAHLLIIELPGGNDVDIIRAAIDRGDAFSFLGADLDFYRQQPVAGVAISLANSQIDVGDCHDDDIERQVLALHRRRPIDAVLCLVDTCIVAAARIAARIGVPFLNPTTAALLRDKFSVRLHLAAAGRPQPDFALALDVDALHQAVERLGLPVIVKPSDGNGSTNIVAIDDARDLHRLDKLLPSRTDYGLGARANDRLLVERRMDGEVIGCDTLSVAGRHQLLGITSKVFFGDGAAAQQRLAAAHPGPVAQEAAPEPKRRPPAGATSHRTSPDDAHRSIARSFAIRGGCFDPHRPDAEQIAQFVFALLDAVGFDHGATHTEVMLTADGPRLIEINPRLVGAKLPRLLNYTLGRSVHDDLIGVHLGVEPDLGTSARARSAAAGASSSSASPRATGRTEGVASPFAATPSAHVSASAQSLHRVGVIRWIAAPQAGTLEAIELPGLNDPRIRCIDMLKRPGDHVRPPMCNVDRIGYVIVCDSSRAEAEALADRFVSLTTLRIRPAAPGVEPADDGYPLGIAQALALAMSGPAPRERAPGAETPPPQESHHFVGVTLPPTK